MTIQSFSKAVVVTALLWGGLGVQHCHADTIDFDFMASFHFVEAPLLDGGLCDAASPSGLSFVQLRNGGTVSSVASLADETIFTCRGIGDETQLYGYGELAGYGDLSGVLDWSAIDETYVSQLRSSAATPEASTTTMLVSGLFVLILLRCLRKERHR